MTEKTEEKNELTAELTAVIEEINEEPVKTKQKGEIVSIMDEHQIMIGDRQYILVKNHREAFDLEKIGERFSDILSRYDYIVGDWGYDQLRLKGFFDVENRKASPDQRIDTLEDYLYEFCNFGCAYFVIKRVGGKREKQGPRRKRNKRSNNNYRPQQQAHTEEKKAPVKAQSNVKKSKPVIRNRKDNTGSNKSAPVKNEKKETANRSFTIRQREEQ